MIRFFRDSSGMDRSASENTLQPHAELEIKDFGKFKIQKLATIGRAPDSDVVLPERSVSRHHARIFYEGGHYWLKDLDSANGTTLNGKKIKLQMLSDNDCVGFGDNRATFHVSGTTSGPALIASDPLEGLERTFEDGTPTGGFTGRQATREEMRIRQLEYEMANLRKEVESQQNVIEGHLKDNGMLRVENDRLRQELRHSGTDRADASRTFTPGESPANSDPEKERLRKLVEQLERALADNNLRLRNLQARIDRENHERS